MKKRLSIHTRLQLTLGLLLVVLFFIFPPQGITLLVVLSILGLLVAGALSSKVANRRQFSYNWLGGAHARAPSLARPALRRSVSQSREWLETNAWLMLIAWSALTVLVHGALQELAAYYNSQLDSVYLMPIEDRFWVMVAITASALPALVLSQIGMKMLLRNRYGDYVRPFCRQLNLDVQRGIFLLTAGGAIGLIVAAVPVVQGLNTFTRFSASEIATRQFFDSQENIHAYNEVESIKLLNLSGQTRRGRTIFNYEIDFSDGTRWNSPAFDSRLVPPLYAEAVQYAAARSEKPVQRFAVSDAFTLGAYGWPVNFIDDESAFVERSIRRGNYDWRVQSKTDATLWQAANMIPVADLILDVECQPLQGPETALCGAMFRSEANDNYSFLIGQDQTIRLYLNYHDRIALIPPRQSTAVRPGAINRITVHAAGSHFTFLVNGQLVAEADDNTLHSGKAGVAMQLPPDHEATFEFRNFQVVEK